MKTIQATTMAVLLAFPHVPQEKPSPTRADLHRFLFFGVFEGLWEDGANVGLIRELRKNPIDYFVAKCFICDAVRQGFDVYLASPGSALGEDSRGPGLPKEITDDLKNPDRKARLQGIQKLVERYVTRRFDRTRMTAEERKVLEGLLEGARKEGMTVKEASFGESCPSCEGATRAPIRK
jgi:hypothetical protein